MLFGSNERFLLDVFVLPTQSELTAAPEYSLVTIGYIYGRQPAVMAAAYLLAREALHVTRVIADKVSNQVHL